MPNPIPEPAAPSQSSAPRRTWITDLALALLVFIITFAPRVHYPVSRPLLWHYRSLAFAEALQRSDWAATYQQYHPGVTAMWLAGPLMKFYQANADTPLARFLFAPSGLVGTQLGREVSVGVMGIALGLALINVATFFALKGLFGRRAALAGALLAALDPFYLENSKVLHVDALTAAFMFLSALLMLRAIQTDQRRYVIASGTVGGLSFLTKSASFFLVLYYLLALGVAELGGLPRQWLARKIDLRAAWAAAWRGVAIPVLVWGVTVGVVFSALWPSMWVQPVRSVREVIGAAFWAMRTPHPNPLFFAGQVITHDPGGLFYVATLGYNTTFITLTLLLTCLALYAIWGKAISRDDRRESLSVWLLVAYIFFFTLQMTLAAKKQPRYVLSVFPVLDALAGLGLARLVDLMAERLGWPRARAKLIGWGAVGLVILGQAAIVLPRHPYYGTHFNFLLGGPRAAAWALPINWQDEGVDLAAQWINQHAEGHDTLVATSGTVQSLLDQYLEARSTRDFTAPADYYVFILNSVMRRTGGYDRWGPLWEDLQYHRPVEVIRFDGLPYVWVYAADTPPIPLNAESGPGPRPTGYDLGATQLQPGEALPLILYWESDPPGNATRVALVDGGGTQLTSGEPSGGEGTSARYTVHVPVDARPGTYRLMVTASDQTTEITQVTIERPGLPALTFIAWLWALGLVGMLAWLARRQPARTPQAQPADMV
jgi:4-amino-4-deoxy-L-arabinose transferase-like glycosyltransferase